MEISEHNLEVSRYSAWRGTIREGSFSDYASKIDVNT